MERRKFSREFKLEAVKLVRDRGIWMFIRMFCGNGCGNRRPTRCRHFLVMGR